MHTPEGVENRAPSLTSTPTRRNILLLHARAVVLNQDFVCLEGTGGAIWRPSIQFSRFACGEEGRRRLPLKGKSVLEISSGLGLGAIVAWHLGASPVVRHADTTLYCRG